MSATPLGELRFGDMMQHTEQKQSNSALNPTACLLRARRGRALAARTAAGYRNVVLAWQAMSDRGRIF
jgi:hypothetical protein